MYNDPYYYARVVLVSTTRWAWGRSHDLYVYAGALDWRPVCASLWPCAVMIACGPDTLDGERVFSMNQVHVLWLYGPLLPRNRINKFQVLVAATAFTRSTLGAISSAPETWSLKASMLWYQPFSRMSHRKLRGCKTVCILELHFGSAY